MCHACLSPDELCQRRRKQDASLLKRREQRRYIRTSGTCPPPVSRFIPSPSSFASVYCPVTGGVDGGVHVTDISNAARTNWMDIRTGRWHPETMALFGATERMLPEIRSNAEVYG